jgi:hypothetical protein
MRELHLACLCAAWCRTCDEYRVPFDAAVRDLAPAIAAAGAVLRPHWVDIEDEADALGDYDVETFPTLLIAEGRGLHFIGPVTPDAAALRALLRRALDAGPAAAKAGGAALPWALVEGFGRR